MASGSLKWPVLQNRRLNHPHPPPAGGRTSIRRAVKVSQSGATADQAATLSNMVLDSRYQVMRRIGEGGMAYVYEARELNTHRVVAVKVISPKLSRDTTTVARLRREAGLAMRLEHPNVCEIIRLGETEDGLIYVVMPFLDGELLSDREFKEGPMGVNLAMPWLIQICAGLHHAHNINIVHRDLKPENVMIVKDRENNTEKAVVMDFGLAKENRADPGHQKLTATGIILGTPEFMSPEQIRGKPLDARSDIYAVGVMAFEMFTGKLPFEGRTAQEMMIARLRGEPTPLRRFRPDLPEALEVVLNTAMESDPYKRYSSTMDLGAALIHAAGGGMMGELQEMLS